jgi:hypothetical protein
MNNDPNRQQWEQQQPPQQQPPTQYEQQQWSQPQPQPQAWEQQPPPAYNQPQWNQPPPNQYAPQQYAPGQYNQYSNVPPYAQPQVQSQQADNFLIRFLMMGMAIRIILLVIVPLLLCGGCAMVVFFATLAHP